MKKTALYLIIVILFGFSCNRKMSPDMTALDKISNFQDLFNASLTHGVECFRIPSLVTAPNGYLIAAIDERVPHCGDLRDNRDINIVLRISKDNGNSWSKVKTVVDFPDGQSASDPSMIVDGETGHIFLFYNFMDLDNENGIYYLHVTESKDNGESWSEPRDITSQVTRQEWHEDFKFITSGRGIQTRDGTILHTLVNVTQNSVYVYGSKDHGKTWFYKGTPVKPGDESKIVELDNGDWMINSRDKEKTGIRYVHVSNDNGDTWKTRTDKQLIDPGNNASLIRYTTVRDGYNKSRLLFSNAKMKDGRKNMTVRISYDEGKTWTEGRTIYDGPSAYSTLTVLENGEIGLLFEKDDYSQNSFVKFSLEWLTEGEDKYVEPR